MWSDIFSFFKRIVTVPDVRKKLLITAGVLVVFRFAAHIPAIGVDRASLSAILGGNALFSLLDIFSGGTLGNFSILALGVGPYITASIIMQLLSYVIPSLDELSKEGEYGQEKINQYTRFLTLPLAVVQGFMMYTILHNIKVIPNLTPISLIALILTMVAGTLFAVWLGELISEYGVGNGVSFLIFGGIIARLPSSLSKTQASIRPEDTVKLVIFLGLSLVVVGLVVFVNEAIRQIPVHYARRLKGSDIPGGDRSFLPLRVNQAGVMPIIFAVSLVVLPTFITQFVAGSGNAQVARIAVQISKLLSPTSIVYNGLYFLLVVAFTYFYTSVVFNPEKIAENLKKGGGFIPGVRPGEQTENYLSFVLNRITLAGACFLGAIAILPSLFQNTIGISTLAIGGTGLLIVVSVVLDLVRTIESKMIMNKYDKFLH